MNIWKSDKHRFFFVHIPKTAGTAIINALQERVGLENLILYTEVDSIQQFINSPNGKEWYNYFSFAFVRNPWDRMVSHYFYTKQICDNPNLLVTKNIKEVNRAKNIVNQLGSDFAFKDYILYRKNEADSLNGSYFQQFGYTQGFTSFIGKFENIQTDLQKNYDRLNLGNINLDLFNNSNHGHYSKYYNNETIQIVSEYCPMI